MVIFYISQNYVLKTLTRDTSNSNIHQSLLTIKDYTSILDIENAIITGYSLDREVVEIKMDNFSKNQISLGRTTKKLLSEHYNKEKNTIEFVYAIDSEMSVLGDLNSIQRKEYHLNDLFLSYLTINGDVRRFLGDFVYHNVRDNQLYVLQSDYEEAQISKQKLSKTTLQADEIIVKRDFFESILEQMKDMRQ